MRGVAAEIGKRKTGGVKSKSYIVDCIVRRGRPCSCLPVPCKLLYGVCRVSRPASAAVTGLVTGVAEGDSVLLETW